MKRSRIEIDLTLEKEEEEEEEGGWFKQTYDIKCKGRPMFHDSATWAPTNVTLCDGFRSERQISPSLTVFFSIGHEGDLFRVPVIHMALRNDRGSVIFSARVYNVKDVTDAWARMKRVWHDLVPKRVKGIKSVWTFCGVRSNEMDAYLKETETMYCKRRVVMIQRILKCGLDPWIVFRNQPKLLLLLFPSI